LAKISLSASSFLEYILGFNVSRGDLHRMLISLSPS
jgi:hypothetical protein